MILVTYYKEDYIEVLLEYIDVIIRFSVYGSRVIELIKLLYSLISSSLAYKLRNSYFISNITFIASYLILYQSFLKLRSITSR